MAVTPSSRSSDTLRRTSKSSQKNRQTNMGQRGLLLFVAINVFFIFSTTIVSGKSISKGNILSVFLFFPTFLL